MNRIYLASQYHRAKELQGYASKLKTLGHEVTSRWITGKWDNARESECAAVDVGDLARAQMLVLFSCPKEEYTGGGGCHIEFGMALAVHKRVVVVGPRTSVFHYLPVVKHYDLWTDCLIQEFFRC